MPTYRVFWSEGNPLVVAAAGFHLAIEKVIAHVHKEDDTILPEDIVRWIDSVEKISDEDPIQ